MKAKYINSLNEEFEKKEKRFVRTCIFIGTKTRWDTFAEKEQKIEKRQNGVPDIRSN